MENPQRENGHIEIANEIVEKLATFHLSGNEWQVFWVVIRKTWGWNKKEDAISLTQFQKETNLSRPSVKEAIDKLVGKKVLVVGKKELVVGKKELGTNTYGFNKLYSQWVVGKKELVGFSVKVVGKKEPKLVGKKEHTIDNKDINTKDIYIDMQNTLLLPENLEKLKTKFPLVDIHMEIEKMIDWRKNNRKRIIDYMAFARNWLRNAKPTQQEVLVI